MKHPVDIDNWNRRENYLFFRDFANPYYSVTSQVDVTEAYIRAKALGIKFSHYAMYASLRAVNSIEALRYRQVDGKVWLYDRIRLNTAGWGGGYPFFSGFIASQGYSSSFRRMQARISLCRYSER